MYHVCSLFCFEPGADTRIRDPLTLQYLSDMHHIDENETMRAPGALLDSEDEMDFLDQQTTFQSVRFLKNPFQVQQLDDHIIEERVREHFVKRKELLKKEHNLNYYWNYVTIFIAFLWVGSYFLLTLVYAMQFDRTYLAEKEATNCESGLEQQLNDRNHFKNHETTLNFFDKYSKTRVCSAFFTVLPSFL